MGGEEIARSVLREGLIDEGSRLAHQVTEKPKRSVISRKKHLGGRKKEIGEATEEGMLCKSGDDKLHPESAAKI